MEGLLYRARVDTVFAGHVDAYECFVSHFVNPNPKFFIINHTTKRLIVPRCISQLGVEATAKALLTSELTLSNNYLFHITNWNIYKYENYIIGSWNPNQRYQHLGEQVLGMGNFRWLVKVMGCGHGIEMKMMNH